MPLCPLKGRGVTRCFKYALRCRTSCACLAPLKWLLPHPRTPGALTLSLDRGCRFSLFFAKPCTPTLNFFARSGPKIEKIDSLWTGRGIGNGHREGIRKFTDSENDSQDLAWGNPPRAKSRD